MTYNGIEFDDYTESEGLWSQVCEKHAGKFNKYLLSSCPGTPICGVAGCNEMAAYYIDFPEDEVEK
jgi:hypothetical protein